MKVKITEPNEGHKEFKRIMEKVLEEIIRQIQKYFESPLSLEFNENPNGDTGAIYPDYSIIENIHRRGYRPWAKRKVILQINAYVQPFCQHLQGIIYTGNLEVHRAVKLELEKLPIDVRVTWLK